MPKGLIKGVIYITNPERRYEVTFTEPAKKYFKKIPDNVKPRITKILDKLERDPYSGDRIYHNLWECRAMKVYRVYYTIIEDEHRIQLLGYDAGFGLVVLLDYSKKDNQQRVIDSLKQLLNATNEVDKLLAKK